jgi:hypothetical protein
LIAPNFLNSASTISTVASKGKFFTKIEYPWSKEQGSVILQYSEGSCFSLVYKNMEDPLTIKNISVIWRRGISCMGSFCRNR